MKLYKNGVWKMVCTWNKNYKGVCRDAFKADGKMPEESMYSVDDPLGSLEARLFFV